MNKTSTRDASAQEFLELYRQASPDLRDKVPLRKKFLNGNKASPDLRDKVRRLMTAFNEQDLQALRDLANAPDLPDESKAILSNIVASKEQEWGAKL